MVKTIPPNMKFLIDFARLFWLILTPKSNSYFGKILLRNRAKMKKTVSKTVRGVSYLEGINFLKDRYGKITQVNKTANG